MGDFITIYTDASYCNQTSTGTYAFFGKTNKGTAKGSGICPEEIDSSFYAEFWAIYKCVEASLKKFPEITGFFVNTDCLQICHLFWPFKNTNPQFKVRQMKKKVEGLVKDRWVRFKHVKAHVRGGDNRNDLNNWMDNECHKLLQKTKRRSRQSK